MKGRFYYYLLLSILFVSCSTDSEIKNFVKRFETAVHSGDRASIERMYPDAVLADSFSFNYIEDSITIAENNGSYDIRQSKETSLVIVKKENDSLIIKNSKGIVAYPDGLLSFAKEVGMLEDDVDDVQKSKLLSDKDFFVYIGKKSLAQLQSRLSVNISYGINPVNNKIPIFATVRNNSEFTIDGADYNLSTSFFGRSCGNFSGKELKPGGSAQFTFYIPIAEGQPYVNINLTVSPEVASYKYYIPKKNDYQLYLKLNGQSSNAKSEKKDKVDNTVPSIPRL